MATATKSITLGYGVEDIPPLGVTLLSAFQHVGLMAIYLVVPLLMARQAGVSPEVTSSILGLSMIALGLGMLLQAWPRLGSGFLAPPVFTGVYVGPSLQAVHLGGLPLLAGMTIFAGLAESAMSRVLRRRRPFMPPELAGLVIVLTGTTNGGVGLKYLLHGAGAEEFGGAQALVALATLTPSRPLANDLASFANDTRAAGAGGGQRRVGPAAPSCRAVVACASEGRDERAADDSTQSPT